MPKKSNVTIQEPGSWDDYAKSSRDDAFGKIYRDAQEFSLALRKWYWSSIAIKRRTSVAIRGASFLLLILGALFPLVSALFSADDFRLACTQMAVITLALAGLLQAADRIFGWSSGWLRYITTVTAMESATRKFQIDWAVYIVSKGPALDDSDRRPLFDLASKFANDISKLQDDETDRWVAEFNTGVAALGDLIQSQKESAEKAIEAARQTLEAHRAEAVARDKGNKLGAIEVVLNFSGALSPVEISLDDNAPSRFLGSAWSTNEVPPGHHIITIGKGENGPKVMAIADVAADGVTRVSVNVPT